MQNEHKFGPSTYICQGVYFRVGFFQQIIPVLACRSDVISKTCTVMSSLRNGGNPNTS